VIEADFILGVQQFAQRVVITRHIQDYVTRLVLATHAHSEFSPKWVAEEILVGASPRAAQAIVSCAKVAAIIDGRFAVSHRYCARTFEAEMHARSAGSMIDRLIEEIPRYVEDGVV